MQRPDETRCELPAGLSMTDVIDATSYDASCHKLIDLMPLPLRRPFGQRLKTN